MVGVVELGHEPSTDMSDVWADVVPLPQDDGPLPLCPILYDPQYAHAMDILRALRARPEIEASERVLDLTATLIRMNPANYTVWNYRTQAITLMAADDPTDGVLRRELDFIDELAHANMKNYQVWQHRRIVIALLGDPSRELSFSADNLAIDAKNYHTWAYREWVLAYFACAESKGAGRGAGEFPELWDGELAFVDALLDTDVRNNSAWSHRWFCCFGRNSGISREDEIAYTANRIAAAPNNQSPGNYLRGLLRKLEPTLPYAHSAHIALMYVRNRNHAAAAATPEEDMAGRTPAAALEWLLEDALERHAAGAADAADTARALFARLRHADPMRERYWQYRERALHN